MTGADALQRALGEHERVISRRQALGLGLSASQIRHRIRPGGPWQVLLPGIYLAATGTPTRRQLEIAALRHAGPGSALTGTAALLHHGVRVPELRLISTLVPAGKHRQSCGFVRVWPTTRMPEFVMADGAVRFTRAARAVVIRTEPAKVTADIRSALRAGTRRPALNIRALPAGG